ncbi:MAG: hypothetical protein AB1916_01420 [Thermodesulfobacteriota bacterium]
MTSPAPRACIGLDLDNTLVDYADLFYRTARELGLLPADGPRDKTGVRDFLRSLPDGELAWQRVQAVVYGPGLDQARPFPGAAEFMKMAAAAGHRLVIVSHKTRHAAQGDGTDLHAAARAWLRKRGFLAPGSPLRDSDVFLEETRTAKVARIRDLGCVLFVDDLPEVFAHPDFPADTARVLFAPDGNPRADFRGAVCSSWSEVARLTASAGPTDLDLRLERLLGSRVAARERLSGGRNSRVSRMDLADGRRVAVKEYFIHPDDGRDRLGVEFSALAFLRSHGLDCVPAPLARDDAGLGVYSWIEGEAAGRTPRPGDAQSMAGFLLRLHGLVSAGRDAGLPPASDACLSLAQAAAAVRRRMARFAGVEHPGFRKLARELEAELAPAEDAGRKRLQDAGLDPDAVLAPELRTLSPSDFGLHNALRVPGGLVFVDFEFFGWDDPAKLAADVLLHPGMDLDRDSARQFTDCLARGLSADPGFRHRLEAAFFLHGLKWCLILCNEFLAGDAARRDFAGADSADARDGALGRARAMLAALRRSGGPWRPVLAA